MTPKQAVDLMDEALEKFIKLDEHEDAARILFAVQNEDNE